MIKKLSILLLLSVFAFSGCETKDDWVSKNNDLQTNIEGLYEDNQKLSNAKRIIDFYNKVTTENMNSFVLVESKGIYNQNKKYSNGVIIGSNGQHKYVLTDYHSIKQDNEKITIMDSYADSYSVNLNNGFYMLDEETGLAVIRFSTLSSKVNTIGIGGKSDIVALLDGINQLNKVTLLNNLKSSTITYNDATYNSYNLENANLNNGSIFINMDNKLMGIYSSKLDAILSGDLLKEMIDFI